MDVKGERGIYKNPLLPFNYPISKKWLITLTAALNTFLFGLNAAAYTVATDTVATLFNISDETFPNSYWPVTSWNMGAAFGAVLVLPLMENYGTRYFYLVNPPVSLIHFYLLSDSTDFLRWFSDISHSTSPGTEFCNFDSL